MTGSETLAEHEALAAAIRAAEHRLDRLRKAATRRDSPPGSFVVGWPDGTAVSADRWSIVGPVDAFASDDRDVMEIFMDSLNESHPARFQVARIIPLSEAVAVAIQAEEASIVCMRAVLGQMLRMAGISAFSILRRGGI
jgi:hypothetical protein